LEFLARNPGRYGGLAAISGSLMGKEVRSFGLSTALQGTPILLGYGEQDKRVPAKRVVDTATVMHHLGARVDLRAYAEWGHSIHQNELALAHEMLVRTATQT
jgi:phospholipase/carboxylesterase